VAAKLGYLPIVIDMTNESATEEEREKSRTQNLALANTTDFLRACHRGTPFHFRLPLVPDD
jgi:hypothetical protein